MRLKLKRQGISGSIGAVGLTCLILLAACASSDRAQDIADLKGDADEGAALYDAYCGDCHGADGAGGDGPSLLRRNSTSLSVAEHADVIIDRMEDRGPRRDRIYLSDQEIADIIAYVLELQGLD